MATGVLVRMSGGSLYLFKEGLANSTGERLDDEEAGKWLEKLATPGSGSGWLEQDQLDELNTYADRLTKDAKTKNVGQIFEVDFNFGDNSTVVPIAGNGSFRG